MTSFRNVIYWFLTRQRKWEQRERPARAVLAPLKLVRVPSAGDLAF